MKHTVRASPFNGPLETGVRVVFLLYSAFPKAMDIQRLTALDYLLVHTGSIGGPSDLHPATPFGTPATQVRRESVMEGLRLMMSKNLVEYMPEKSGLMYKGGSAAELFCRSLQSSYLKQLAYRADWLTEKLCGVDEDELDDLMKNLFQNWVSEFSDQETFIVNPQ